MYASELIEALQKIVAEKGDCLVFDCIRDEVTGLECEDGGVEWLIFLESCTNYLLGKKLSYWKERHIAFWACGDFLGNRDHRITKAISLTRKKEVDNETNKKNN